MEPEIDDIKNLNKKQLILLTLLITFVVSIATGVITVSIMNQMPKAVPQTINNVIQRTIEKVSTVEVPSSTDEDKSDSSGESNTSSSAPVVVGSSDSLLSIYNSEYVLQEENTSDDKEESIGQGIIISESGLILVDSRIVRDGDVYKVVLGGKLFNASRLKDFDNGFTVLKISVIPDISTTEETTNQTEEQ